MYLTEDHPITKRAFYRLKRKQRKIANQWLNKDKPNKPKKLKRSKLPYLENYRAYLVSPHWQATRKEFFEKNKYECTACGSSDSINLHHATYKRMGIEEEGDLVALCQDCHQKVHELQKETKQDLYQVTYYFIDQMRQIDEFADIIRKRNLFLTP